MVDDEELPKLLSWSNLAKQGVAGIAEQVMGSPQAPDALKWVPNGAFGLYSLLDAGNSLADQALNKYVGTSIPEAHLPGAVAAGDIYRAGTDQTNETLGIQEPQTWQETVARSLPAALLPGPGKLEQGATAVSKVARNVGDLLLPFNSSRTATQAVLGTALPTAVSEIAHQDDPDYVGLTNGTTTAKPVQDFSSFGKGLEADAPQPDNDFTAFGKALEAGDPVQDIKDGIQAKDDAGWSFKQAATAAAAVTGAALVLGGGLSAYRAAIRSPLMQTTALSGVKDMTDEVSTMAKVNGALFDYSAPVYDAVKQVNSSSLDALRAKYGLSVSPASNASKIQDVALTGIWPNGERGPKLAVILQSLSGLGPDKTQMFDDIMRAADKQEQMLAERVNVWGNANTGIETYGSLDGWKAIKAANPDVAKLVDDTKAFFGNARKYMLDKGVITPDEFNELSSQRSNYLPDVLNKSDDSFWTKMMTTAQNGGSIESDTGPIKLRSTLQEGVPPGEILPASQVLPQYLHQIISFSERNEARRDLMDTLDGSVFVKKVDGAGQNVVTVLRNGEPEHYRVEDNALWASMIHNPTILPGIFNSTRRIMTEFTVGAGNPAFALLNAQYESLAAALLRKPNRGTGLITEGLNKVGATGAADLFNKVVPFDPTTLVSPFLGAARGMAADTAIRASTMLESSLNSQGLVSRLLGPQLTKQLADIMGNAYENSVLHVARQEGAGYAPVIEHWASGKAVTDPAEYAPSFARMVATSKINQLGALPIVRNYMALASMLHNGTRLEHMAANIRENMSAADKSQLAYDTRTLTADVGTHGANEYVQYANQGLPWFNVTAQTGKALAKRFIENPGAFTSRLTAFGLTGLAYMTAQMVNNPAALDTYVNKWTPQQRADRIPFIDGDGNVMHEFAPIQEFRLLWSPLVEGFLTMSGLKSEHAVPQSVSQTFMKAINNALNGQVWDERAVQDVQSGALEAGKQVMPSLTPPIGGAILGASGVDPSSMLMVGRNSADMLHPERITSDKTDAIADRFISQNWETAITQLTGSLGQQIVNSTDAFLRTNKAGYKPSEQWQSAWANFIAHEKDQATAVGGPMLWDWQKNLSSQDANAKLVEAKMKNLKQLRADFMQSADEQQQGRTPRPGIDSYSIYVPDDLKGTMLGAIANAANPTMRVMQTNFLPQIQSLYKKIDETKAAASMQPDVETQRRTINDITQQIRDKYGEAFKFMRDQETLLGQQFGVPNFRFDDLNFKALKQTPQGQ